MGLGALEIICAKLVENGLPGNTPAAVVHAATTPRQRIVTSTLADLPAQVRAAGLKTPSLIVVGTVVELQPLVPWLPPVTEPVRSASRVGNSGQLAPSSAPAAKVTGRRTHQTERADSLA